MTTTEIRAAARSKMQSQNCLDLFKQDHESFKSWILRFVESKAVINSFDDNYIIVLWSAARVLLKATLDGRMVDEERDHLSAIFGIVQTFLESEFDDVVNFIIYKIGLDVDKTIYKTIAYKTAPVMQTKKASDIRTKLLDVIAPVGEEWACKIHQECELLYASLGIDLSPY